jgi:hypothetical protein
LIAYHVQGLQSYAKLPVQIHLEVGSYLQGGLDGSEPRRVKPIGKPMMKMRVTRGDG